MDSRVHSEVLKHRTEVLDREYTLVEEAHRSLSGECRFVDIGEHLENPENAFREFVRALKRGGVLCVKTPNLWNYTMLVSWATPTFLHNLFLKWTGWTENTPTFYRANTRRRLAELARTSGFKVRHLESQSSSYIYYSFNKPIFYFMRLLSRLSGRLTNSPQQLLLCVFEKA
jgi:SAM-dependent methyltransferase